MLDAYTLTIGGEERELNQLLKNPKQMEAMAFEEGIGFVPFGGYGLEVYQAIHKSESKEPIVKAMAIKTLTNDTDPRSEMALVAAIADQHWLVRAAAYGALARPRTFCGVAELEFRAQGRKRRVETHGGGG